jgi:predicted AAA+ superfamily ATPase
MGQTVRKAIRAFPGIVITGPRQSGKTTFLREEFGAKFRYVSLEDPDQRAVALTDPRSFLKQNCPPVILDEIQHTPDLLSYIKTIIDADRKPGQWILTGSQNFPLMEGVTQSLAGRAAVLQLHGLSAEELPREDWRDTPSEILSGSFPEPRLSPRIDLRLWMGSYLQTYLERDVRQLTQVGDLVSFERFTRLCAARSSGLLNIAELARDGAISVTTARRWLSVLEASGQFIRLPPYARSKTKRMVKSPKVYAVDTGLAAFLTGHRDEDVLWHGPLKGALFETLVLGEIFKYFHNAGDSPSITFWRSSDGREVDFVLEAAGKAHGIEVKANASPVPRMADFLIAWRKLLGDEAGKTVVVCDCAERQPLAPDVEAIPWREIGSFLSRVFIRE